MVVADGKEQCCERIEWRSMEGEVWKGVLVFNLGNRNDDAPRASSLRHRPAPQVLLWLVR